MDPYYRPEPSDTPSPLLPGYAQVLVGSLVSSAHILDDEDGVRGVYFIFQDLSIRTLGEFKIKVHIFENQLSRQVFSI